MVKVLIRGGANIKALDFYQRPARFYCLSPEGRALLEGSALINEPDGVKNGKKSISRKALSELIENSMSKILRHCMNCLEENNLFNYIPAGIVITGGSANMEGMVKLGEKLTNLKVKIGIPKYNLPQKSDNLLKPENSAILGITKFYALEQDKEFTFNQSKGIIARVLEWIRTEL